MPHPNHGFTGLHHNQLPPEECPRVLPYSHFIPLDALSDICWRLRWTGSPGPPLLLALPMKALVAPASLPNLQPQIPPHFLICPVVWSIVHMEAAVCSSSFCALLFKRFQQCYQKLQCLTSEKNSKDFTWSPLFLELTSESIGEGKKASLSTVRELSTHQALPPTTKSPPRTKLVGLNFSSQGEVFLTEMPE